MPFDAPFRNYQDGDLCYGLGWKRAEMMQQICGAANIPNGDRLGWIDLFLFPTNQYRALDAQDSNRDFADTLLAHPKYSRALDPNTREGIDGNSEFRAKSKGGLLWATQNANKHVHFSLDGLDMLQVVTKSYPGRPGTGVGRDSPAGTPSPLKERSITGSELRWVYRWRNNANVKNLIQFWRKDSFFKTYRQCTPPWTWHNGGGIWLQYNPHTLAQ